MKIKVDTRELKQLQKKLEKSQAEIKQLFIDTSKEIAQEFLQEVIRRTPSSNTNDLKNDWKCDFNVVQNGNTYTITVKNENEIASLIEYGHRTENNGFKQGHFIMTITEHEIQQKFDKVAQRKVEDFLKGVFS